MNWFNPKIFLTTMAQSNNGYTKLLFTWYFGG